MDLPSVDPLRSCRARTLTCNRTIECMQYRAIRACFRTHTPRTNACSFTRLLSARNACLACQIVQIITNLRVFSFCANSTIIMKAKLDIEKKNQVWVMYKVPPEKGLEPDGCNVFLGENSLFERRRWWSDVFELFVPARFFVRAWGGVGVDDDDISVGWSD